MSFLTPNMSLLGISIGIDSGLTIEQNYNSNMALLDQHNHAAGSGVQIQPSGINISSDLPFNTNNAISLRTCRFVAQVSAIPASSPDLGCIYVAGVDLWYNDLNGNQVQMTSGGSVLASSSGISSGTASASFSGGVLVVLAATNTPANIQCGSVLLGNNSPGTHYLTLAPPSAMAANYGLTLPSLPSVTSIMAIDTSGNMTGAYTVDNSTIKISGGVIGVPSQGITASQIANGTITGTQIASSVNLNGKAVQEASKNVVVSNTNATNSLAIIRGEVGGGGTVASGEGFSVVRTGGVGNYAYVLTWTAAFGDNPTVVASSATTSGLIAVIQATPSTSGATINWVDLTGTIQATDFHFIAIGQRA